MDCLSQAVVRGREGRYLLVETRSRKLQIAYCRVKDDGDFASSIQAHLTKELSLDAEIQGIIRVQHQTGQLIATTHRLTITYLAEERPGGKSGPNVTAKWLSVEELKSKSSYVLDPAVLKLLLSVDEETVTVSPTSLVETMDALGRKKVPEEGGAAVKKKEQGEKALEEQMLEQSGYHKNELDQLKELFLTHCGSQPTLDLEGFTSLMTSLDYPAERCERCYRAFSGWEDPTKPRTKKRDKGLTVEGLQVGLCAMDPSTPHGGLSAQFRCQFIFRFYNTSQKDVLSFTEFKEIVRDICTLKKMSVTEADLEKAARDNWHVFNVPEEAGISMQNFLSVVGQLKFRGTSVLFRLPRTPVTKKTKKQDEDTGSEKIESMDTSQPSMPDSIRNVPMVTIENDEESVSAPPLTDDPQEFNIATHCVKVRRSGTLADVTTLWDMVNTEAVSGSMDAFLERPGFSRLTSLNAFDRQSKSNEMLSGLRYFEHALKDNGRGQPKPQFSWGAVDLVSVAQCFLQLCAKAVDVFSSEPRLLEISSPTYVLGDIHGNFHDLVCFEKVLWRMGPVLTPASFLFLGDYVDRGRHGFEVVAYLFAQKLLMPSKFTLIRGNHEIRAVQEAFSYKSECLSKFGDQLGLEVWEATNQAFDRMPLAAVIDDKVFCVHGGIPLPTMGGGLISAINDIPGTLSDPMETSALAWDIMWNDPIRGDEITEEVDQQLQENLGFVDNFARGTAHMFSVDALEAFLERNKLSHVIRAHECKAAGFQLQQRGRLLTVFSSSHYCGFSNEAACVLVHARKIRIIRLDTS